MINNKSWIDKYFLISTADNRKRFTSRKKRNLLRLYLNFSPTYIYNPAAGRPQGACRVTWRVKKQMDLGRFIFMRKCFLYQKKIHFFRVFVLATKYYLGQTGALTFLYHIEARLNALLMRILIVPNLKTANIVIRNRYIIVDGIVIYKPITPINLLGFVQLIGIARYLIFLFKAYRESYLGEQTAVKRFILYNFYRKRHIVRKYYFFRYYPRQFHLIKRMRFIQPKQPMQLFFKPIRFKTDRRITTLKFHSIKNRRKRYFLTMAKYRINTNKRINLISNKLNSL
jgi:hypothetical protein